MEIKQKTETSLITRRRYVVRRLIDEASTSCARCGAATLKTEPAAVLFGINQRRIFQLIETGAAHFSETASGATLICLLSLDAFVSGDADQDTALNKKD